MHVPEQNNRQIVLRQHPKGLPTRDDFKCQAVGLPAQRSGELLLENLVIGLTPGDRLAMNRRIRCGDVIRAHTLARIIEAGCSKRFDVGDLVVGHGGWQDYFVSSEEQLRRAPSYAGSATVNLGTLGTPGLTAYFGLLTIGQAEKGDTIVVSGASGTVGSLVGQIGKILGCRVVAICRDCEERQRWLLDELGFDAVVDEQAVFESLIEECPDGVDLFFDNVGGDTLDTVLRFISRRGRDRCRVVCCGMISQYNRASGTPAFGVRSLHTLINRRVRMVGFVVGDFEDRYPQALDALAQWLREGRLKYREEFTQGLENIVGAFIRFMERRSFGKQLVQIASMLRSEAYASRR